MVCSLQAQYYNTTKYGPCSQIRFSVMPALYNNLDYQNVGVELFRSSVGVGGEFVVSYGQAIWKGLGINAGVGFGLVPYNFSMGMLPESSAFSDEDFSLSFSPNRNMDLIFTFPVMLEKKFLLVLEDRLFMNIEAGVKWNIKSRGNFTSRGSYGTWTDDGENIRYFECRFTNADEVEFISYVFKAGLLKVNRRGNSFSWNIVLQQSSSRLFTGTYAFDEFDFESFGTTELHNSYIGMELIYALTLDRKDKWKGL